LSECLAENDLAVFVNTTKIENIGIRDYSKWVLMHPPDSTVIRFARACETKLQTKAVGADEIEYTVSLTDLWSGKPIDFGTATITLKVGASTLEPLKFHAETGGYEIWLSSRSGKPPAPMPNPD
jgi:hypothetical protein